MQVVLPKPVTQLDLDREEKQLASYLTRIENQFKVALQESTRQFKLENKENNVVTSCVIQVHNI